MPKRFSHFIIPGVLMLEGAGSQDLHYDLVISD